MPPPTLDAAVYGSPDPDLAGAPVGAQQFSPLRPGSQDAAAWPDASIGSWTVAAPAGAAERRFMLAQALRTLAPGGSLVALAPRDRGGSRLRGELERFGAAVAESYRAHQRICRAEAVPPGAAIADAIAAGAPRLDARIGLHTQPGVFSFDRIDPGSALLGRHLPEFAGRGADLGSGLGVLSRAILRGPRVAALGLVELDRRAVEASRLNVEDPRASFHWADACALPLRDLDFAVTNPPFHLEGEEDRGLGQRFIAAAAAMLRPGGLLLLVANRHLPYEAAMRERFRAVDTVAEEAGYKILRGRR